MWLASPNRCRGSFVERLSFCFTQYTALTHKGYSTVYVSKMRLRDRFDFSYGSSYFHELMSYRHFKSHPRPSSE